MKTREREHCLVHICAVTQDVLTCTTVTLQSALMFLFKNRYLRIKRQNQTYFVTCNPDDTFGYLKEQVALANNGEYEAKQMRMILPKDSTILNDDDKISSREEIKSESELYVVFAISDGEFEPVQVVVEDPTAAAAATD